MMRWDGWMRSSLKIGAAVLAFGIMGDLAYGQAKPTTQPATKPVAAPAPAPAPAPAEEAGQEEAEVGAGGARSGGERRVVLRAARGGGAAGGVSAMRKTGARGGKELCGEIDYTEREK